MLRKVDGPSFSVFACGSVVVSQGEDGVSVYDEDLTLLHTLSHAACTSLAVSDCGGWVITSSWEERNARLWDVNTCETVACVPVGRIPQGCPVALSRSASAFAVDSDVKLYDWSGAALGSFDVHGGRVGNVQFTPCGKYLVVSVSVLASFEVHLYQYDAMTLSCVREFTDAAGPSFVISPCSRVIVYTSMSYIATRNLHPHSE